MPEPALGRALGIDARLPFAEVARNRLCGDRLAVAGEGDAERLRLRREGEGRGDAVVEEFDAGAERGAGNLRAGRPAVGRAGREPAAEERGHGGTGVSGEGCPRGAGFLPRDAVRSRKCYRQKKKVPGADAREKNREKSVTDRSSRGIL